MKICSKCKINKENKEFCKDKDTKTGLCSYCRSCLSEYNRNRKPLRLVYQRKYGIEKHGITVAEYEEAAKSRNYCCWLCGKRNNKRCGLAVDHDHFCKFKIGHKYVAGQEYGCRECIRGLLCVCCNGVIIPFLEKFIPEYPYLLGRPFSKGMK